MKILHDAYDISMSFPHSQAGLNKAGVEGIMQTKTPYSLWLIIIMPAVGSKFLVENLPSQV
jgi:hypothetical protein